MNLLKPTFWASVVYLVAPSAFLLFGWAEMHSPEWDVNDSGAVQGYVYFAIASLSALLCVLLVFPGIAKLLGSSFTSRNWIYLNIVAIALVAFLASVAFCFLAGFSSFAGIFENALILAIPLTIICLVLLAPAMFVWLRVVRTNA